MPEETEISRSAAGTVELIFVSLLFIFRINFIPICFLLIKFPVVMSCTIYLTFKEEDDLPYEEDILRNPYSIKCWLRYIEHKRQLKAIPQVINFLYERALKELPGSYKLWYQYLGLRRKQVKKFCITDPAYEDVNLCFRRALVFMHKVCKKLFVCKIMH